MSRPIFESTNHPLRRNRQRIRKIPLKSTISEGFWSEWRDSNARLPHPKCGALPTGLHPDIQFLSLYHGGEENQRFSVCGHLCGQSRFCAVFGNRRKSRKGRCHKALRRFALPCPGYRHGTPKAGALPTALHPVIEFFIRLGVFSQSKRATNCATPRYGIHFASQIRF